MSNISQVYKEYYYYKLPDGSEPGDVVNSLYDRIMRNDAEALEEVLKILGSNTYYLAYKRLSAYGMGTVENVDDLMQTVRLEITKLAFRGFSSDVTEEYFYGHLLKIVENQAKDYKKRIAKKKKREQYETDEYSVFDFLEMDEETAWEDPETATLAKEWKYMKSKIFEYFEQALANTDIKPYQVLTYCYAILLPQLFKKSQNPSFLEKVDKLSSRKSSVANSTYNRINNRLEGEIARKSVILINWALEAMHKQKISELSQEVLELYREEPLTNGESDFTWKEMYVKNLESDCNGKTMKDVVIPDDFEKLQIKNWPSRVARKLFEETEKKVQTDTYFDDKSIKLAELLACR